MDADYDLFLSMYEKIFPVSDSVQGQEEAHKKVKEHKKINFICIVQNKNEKND